MLVLGLRVPLGHLVLGPLRLSPLGPCNCSPTLYTSNSIIRGCSAPPKLFRKPPPNRKFQQPIKLEAAKLLHVKSGELLMTHDSSLMTQRCIQEAKFSLKNKKDFGMIPPLKKAKKQGEKPLPSLGPIPLKNVEFRDGMGPRLDRCPRGMPWRLLLHTTVL